MPYKIFFISKMCASVRGKKGTLCFFLYIYSIQFASAWLYCYTLRTVACWIYFNINTLKLFHIFCIFLNGDDHNKNMIACTFYQNVLRAQRVNHWINLTWCKVIFNTTEKKVLPSVVSSSRDIHSLFWKISRFSGKMYIWNLFHYGQLNFIILHIHIHNNYFIESTYIILTYMQI